MPRKQKGRAPRPPVAPRRDKYKTVQENGQLAEVTAVTRGKDVEIAERRIKALTLYKNGAPFRVIAQECQVDISTSWADVQAEMLALRKLAEPLAEEARTLALERLADLWRWNVRKAQAGDTKALLAAIKIEERRARLLGLDAPSKVEVTPKKEPVTDEQLAKEFELLPLAERETLLSALRGQPLALPEYGTVTEGE